MSKTVNMLNTLGLTEKEAEPIFEYIRQLFSDYNNLEENIKKINEKYCGTYGFYAGFICGRCIEQNEREASLIKVLKKFSE